VDCAEVSVRVQLDHGLGTVDVTYETSMQHDGTPQEPMELVRRKFENVHANRVTAYRK